MEHAAIIERLGGAYTLADALGLHWTSVAKWRAVSIPPARWTQIAAVAKERGAHDVTLDALAEGEANHVPARLKRGRKARVTVGAAFEAA
jgi:DNA-binding transcriptional regulator YdaS (Cro superfamily)